MTRFLRRIIARLRPVIVSHQYKVEKTDLAQKRSETTARLAKELGRPNPLRGA